MFNFKEFIERKMKWSFETFGEQEVCGVIDHIKDELLEVKENPEAIEEWIDIILLAIDGASRVGFSADDIINELERKLQINTSRRWEGVEKGTSAIKHIKD